MERLKHWIDLRFVVLGFGTAAVLRLMALNLSVIRVAIISTVVAVVALVFDGMGGS